jgi:hypothetical protein
MSKSPNERPSETGIFLMRRHEWFLRVMMLPQRSDTGDLGAVQDALLDVIDAAGGVEFSRGELLRVIEIAQEEYSSLQPKTGILADVRSWSGATTPAVYYAFFETAFWTRTVLDRFKEPLKSAIQPYDGNLWNKLQRIRSISGGRVFEDARCLARVGLHRYTPPYAGSGARVVDGRLIYPIIDAVTDDQNFRNNLRFEKGRDAEMLAEEYWSAICRFVDGILDEFYSKE